LLWYLRTLASLQLRKYAPDIIGITGSAGKTSTLNAVEAVLKDKYSLKVSHKANSQWGIPADILGLKTNQYAHSYVDWGLTALKAPWQLMSYWRPHEKYLVEMGVDSPYPPSNMEYLLKLIRPRTSIFLNVEPMHSQPFDHLVKEKKPERRRQLIRQEIAKQKGLIITSLPGNGLAILNQDDDIVRTFTTKTQAQVMTFGTNQKSDVKIIQTSTTLAGSKFTYRYQDQEVILHLKNYLLPTHYAHSFAAALCIAIDEDFTLEEGISLIQKNFHLPPGRSTLIPGIKASILIDSSYNASAKPTTDLIEMISGLDSKRFYCLLGDMRELGEETQSEHELVARVASDHATQIFLTGPAMKQYTLPLINSLKPNQASWYESGAKAAEALKKILKPTDIVLIKGSQNTLFLETAVEALMKDPSQADKLLCRRGKFWDMKRKSSI
jgi:UDP-N-acetylmuramoyl-tripeptide--D-alanyl-D-alanine ligase